MTRFLIGDNEGYRPRHTKRHRHPGLATRLLCRLAIRLAV